MEQTGKTTPLPNQYIVVTNIYPYCFHTRNHTLMNIIDRINITLPEEMSSLAEKPFVLINVRLILMMSLLK